MPYNWNFPPVVPAGELGFDEAMQLVAALPKQWVKITIPGEYHFYGNWRGRTTLEFAIRYLALFDKWTDVLMQFNIHGVEEYDKVYGLVTQFSRFDENTIRDVFSTSATAPIENDAKSILQLTTWAAQRACGKKTNKKLFDCLQKIMSANYKVISENTVDRLKSEATKPNQANKRWLKTLLKFAKYKQNPVQSSLIIATPTDAYINHLDFVIDELLALDKQGIEAVFAEWGAGEAEHNLQVIESIRTSIKYARRWSAPFDECHLNSQMAALLDALCYHIRCVDTDPSSLSLAELKDTLGIAIGELSQCEPVRPVYTIQAPQELSEYTAKGQIIDLDIL
jgi:hypothetical protein